MSVEEKQARSVFVGNIPHGTTEEQMKDIFSTVGTVLSFRIVYDRETGNPKGYGFAEYADIEMAQSAIRNLNGYEFNGRTLRVDKASSQADELRMIHQQTGGPPVENPYGENVSPDKAPEAISRAVASLPPEQMFELMKQMKTCIQNNMNEARTTLLNNPQLAYALLQAQVVMRIVEPKVAMALLHRKPDQIPPIMPSTTSPIQIQGNIIRPLLPTVMPLMTPVVQTVPPQIPAGPPIRMPAAQPTAQQPMRPGFDQMMDPRYQPRPAMPIQTPPVRPSGQVTQSATQQQSQTSPTTQPSAQSQQATSSNQQTSSSNNEANSAISSVDQEKAVLIMQVLQLTEEQIAILPPEQRESILKLKEQIAQSAGGLVM